MKIPSRLATTASCATLAFAMSGLAQEVSPPDDPAVVRWASQMYEPVAEVVFGPPIADALELEIAWVATARIHFAYESEPEVQFALRKTWEGGVTGDVARLRKPLLRQLRTLYRDHRQLPPAELAKLVEVDRRTLSGDLEVALSELAASFEQLEVPLGMTNMLVLDSRNYELWLDAGPQSVHLSLVGASNGETPVPVIRWIETALDVIEGRARRWKGDLAALPQPVPGPGETQEVTLLEPGQIATAPGRYSTPQSRASVTLEVADLGGYLDLYLDSEGRGPATHLGRDTSGFAWLSPESIVFSTSPIYGKPGIFCMNLASDLVWTRAKPTTFRDTHPEEADYFELESVALDGRLARIDYSYVKDVEQFDFSVLETEAELRTLHLDPLTCEAIEPE